MKLTTFFLQDTSTETEIKMMTTFCCCIPTRLAVLILAPITAFFSTVFSIGLIKGLIDYWNTLRMNHQISLILLTIVVVVVAIASVMGFFGAIVRNFNSVNAYSQTLYSLCVAFLIVGIVNIVLMFKGRQELIDSCERQQDQPEWSCKRVSAKRSQLVSVK